MPLRFENVSLSNWTAHRKFGQCVVFVNQRSASADANAGIVVRLQS